MDEFKKTMAETALVIGVSGLVLFLFWTAGYFVPKTAATNQTGTNQTTTNQTHIVQQFDMKQYYLHCTDYGNNTIRCIK